MSRYQATVVLGMVLKNFLTVVQIGIVKMVTPSSLAAGSPQLIIVYTCSDRPYTLDAAAGSFGIYSIYTCTH
jgi:hypothetical protein